MHKIHNTAGKNEKNSRSGSLPKCAKPLTLQRRKGCEDSDFQKLYRFLVGVSLYLNESIQIHRAQFT